MKKDAFFVALFLYGIALFYVATTTPISPHEAKIFYTSEDIVGLLMHWGGSLFSGFLGLRIYFILFALLSIALFFLLSWRYFKRAEDAYLSTMIFMLLPGTLTASTLANIAIIVLPLVLLFVLLYKQYHFSISLLIMVLLFMIHDASIIFFVALLLYGIRSREYRLMLFSSLFLGAFILLERGIEIGGHPSGHFLEIFGLYAGIFSPLLFLFFFYAMYRTLLRGEKTLLWYIAFTALAFSLLLSLRQRVAITDFAPYVMIATILMLETFHQSVRVRLPAFRKKYRLGFGIVTTLLLLTLLAIVFHQLSYTMMSNPQNHFAKRIYRPYFLAKQLKSQGISCYCSSGKERYQLQYYGISHCCK